MPARDTATARATFPRSYRLKRRALIRALFDRTRTDVGSVAGGCLRIVYRVIPRAESTDGAPVQVAFSPGRTVQTAVGRNRIKRVLREVYREHQHILIDLFLHTNHTLTAMVLFRGDPDAVGPVVRKDLPALLVRLAGRLGATPAAGNA